MTSVYKTSRKESLLLRVPDLFPYFDFILWLLNVPPEFLFLGLILRNSPQGTRASGGGVGWGETRAGGPACVDSPSWILEASRVPPQPWGQT